VIGGDWVAHLLDTAARRILVTCPLLVAVSGKAAQNLLASGCTSRRKACCNFSITPGLPFAFPFSSRRRDFLRDMFPPSLYYFSSLVFTWKMRKQPESGWSISHYFSF
jgi:hypothetical protein